MKCSLKADRVKYSVTDQLNGAAYQISAEFMMQILKSLFLIGQKVVINSAASKCSAAKRCTRECMFTYGLFLSGAWSPQVTACTFESVLFTVHAHNDV